MIDWENDPDAAGKFLRRWAAQMALINAATQQAMPTAGAYVPPKPNRNRYYGPHHERITNNYGTGRYEIRTKQIAKQLEALGCERYIVSVTNTDGTVVGESTATPATIIKMQHRLGKYNAQGHNIFIKPAPRQIEDGTAKHEPYLFLDNLEPKGLARLRDAGLHMTATIKTADKHLSGWVRLDSQLLTTQELKVAAHLLERRYGVKADAGQRSGRLAGMTNQDIKQSNCRSPFIRISTLEDRHVIAPGAQFIMSQTRRILSKIKPKKDLERYYLQTAITLPANK